MKTNFLLLFIAVLLLKPANCSALAMRPMLMTNACCGLVTTNFAPAFLLKSDYPPAQPQVRTLEDQFLEAFNPFDSFDRSYILRIGGLVFLLMVRNSEKEKTRLIKRLAKYEPRQV